MSFLRRRILGDPSSSEPSRDASPARDNEGEGDNGNSRDDKDEEYKIIPASKLQKLQKLTKKKSSSKRRNVWIFGLGGLFGILLAVFFAGNSDMVDLASLTDLNLDSILDVLPAGLVKDAQALQVCIHSSRG